ncbi:helix-turn-helix domain-containing protein [Streptomyces sp. NPDC002666]
MTNYADRSEPRRTDSDEERAARAEEDATAVYRITADLEEKRKTNYYDHPLDGLDSESLASFNLRRIRKAVGLSQQQIADRIADKYGLGEEVVKLSQTQIAKIERGERPWRLNELVAIAAAIGVGLDEFFAAQDASNDGQTLVLTAKLKYQRAQAMEEEAREILRDAIRATYEKENALIRAAAEHGIKDPRVMQILTDRALRQETVEAAEKDLDEPIDGPGLQKRADERTGKAMTYVANEWLRFRQEAGFDLDLAPLESDEDA